MLRQEGGKMIWVAVCDGASAKIFKKEHRFSPLEYLESFTHAHELTHEHGRDKPGRGFGKNGGRHTYAPQTDWHDSQKEIFTQQISAYLLNAFKEHSFSKIYLISPAKIVKVYRDFFDQHIDTLHKKNLSIIEIHKDLIHCTTEEIENVILKAEGWD